MNTPIDSRLFRDGKLVCECGLQEVPFSDRPISSEGYTLRVCTFFQEGMREYLNFCVIACSSFHLKGEGIFAINHVDHGQEQRFNYQIKAL